MCGEDFLSEQKCNIKGALHPLNMLVTLLRLATTWKLYSSHNTKSFLLALLIEQLKTWQETGWERGGVTRSKGPQARTRIQVRCSKDKASVHRMPALPSELDGAHLFCLLFLTLTQHLMENVRFLLRLVGLSPNCMWSVQTDQLLLNCHKSRVWSKIPRRI